MEITSWSREKLKLKSEDAVNEFTNNTELKFK